MPDSLIRMSVGIENIDDILKDIEQAFKQCLKFDSTQREQKFR